MNMLRHFITFTTAIAATILAVLPLLVAIDFGGVLWWTQYMAALAIVVAFCLTLPTLLAWSTYFRPRQLLVLIPLMLWTAYAAFQTVPLSPGLVKILSPASHSAYTEWLEPILPAEALPQTFPISIAVDDSIHAVAMLGIVLVLTWTSLQVFNTRARLIGLLTMVAITGASIAALGIVSLVLPGLPFFDVIKDSPGAGFSTFVNRNNAALAMNIGLAASFGLLGWRLSALTGTEIDGEDFEFIDLFSLTSDRDSLIGIASGVLCMVGILVCGSRSGVGAVLLGTLLSLGWLRQRKGFTTIPVVMVCGATAVALLMVPLKLNLESIKRLELFSSESSTILNDGRFHHWPEGFAAGMDHLPSGSGLSTYAYAYLPYQNEVPKSWFLHADNLWLELFVEQGVVGIIVAISLLLSLIWCLAKMSQSHDALDHGLRITGWYCLAAIVFTQFLDFGLIIPGNFLLIVPLFAAIVVRSVESDLVVVEEVENQSKFDKLWVHPIVHRIQYGFGVIAACGVAAAAYSSIGSIAIDTRSDSMVRYVQARLSSGPATIDALNDLRKRLPANGSRDLRMDELEVVADVERRIARLEDVMGMKPSTQKEYNAISLATKPNFRRLTKTAYQQTLKKSPERLADFQNAQVQSGYINAVQAYQDGLQRTPLNRNARQGLLITDFVDPNLARSTQLLTQLQALYIASSNQTRDLAILASQSGFNELATELWRRAIELSPDKTLFYLQSIAEYSNLQLTEILPALPAVYRDVTQDIVRRRDSSMYHMIPNLIDGMDCDNCETVQEKSRCLSIAAKAAQANGSTAEAIAYATDATETSPIDANMRLHLIELLRADNQRPEALKHARLGRMNAPGDGRFDDVIKRMAELDIMAEQ